MAAMATMYGLKVYTRKELRRMRADIDEFVELEADCWMSIGDYTYLEDIIRENYGCDEDVCNA